MKNVEDIREHFRDKRITEDFVIDKTGVKMIEIISAQFVADEPYIFGQPNADYIRRELDWYDSESLNVYDIEEPVPKIWKDVADKDGFINSNYGWCVWSDANGNQYEHALKELQLNPYSRRAQMIYTRPSMWQDYNKNGMSDFMCTSNTQHFIRKDKLITSVYMRSNDAIYGYNNDYAWFSTIHESLSFNLNVELGPIIWHAGSIHVYERHFNLVK